MTIMAWPHGEMGRLMFLSKGGQSVCIDRDSFNKYMA